MDGMIFNKSEEADEKHAARRIVRDWSIIGVVPASAVESCMNAVQANTIMLLLALFAAILFGMSKIFHDESKMRRERAEAEKQELANTDALTGQLNKRYFDAVVGALERRRQAFAVFYLDLDRFKPVNDTYVTGFCRRSASGCRAASAVRITHSVWAAMNLRCCW